MGNYENLKQSITEVIKTNGNQEITGAVLQSTLLTIISAVGANATFAGIATPTTNPGTPDGPIFYLASESGTYSNFNAIELQNGLSVLMWNGSWSSQQIFSIDNEPTQGSNNLAESGGVYASIHKSLDLSQIQTQYGTSSNGSFADGTTDIKIDGQTNQRVFIGPIILNNSIEIECASGMKYKIYAYMQGSSMSKYCDIFESDGWQNTKHIFGANKNYPNLWKIYILASYSDDREITDKEFIKRYYALNVVDDENPMGIVATGTWDATNHNKPDSLNALDRTIFTPIINNVCELSLDSTQWGIQNLDGHNYYSAFGSTNPRNVAKGKSLVMTSTNMKGYSSFKELYDTINMVCGDTIINSQSDISFCDRGFKAPNGLTFISGTRTVNTAATNQRILFGPFAFTHDTEITVDNGLKFILYYCLPEDTGGYTQFYNAWQTDKRIVGISPAYKLTTLYYLMIAKTDDSSMIDLPIEEWVNKVHINSVDGQNPYNVICCNTWNSQKEPIGAYNSPTAHFRTFLEIPADKNAYMYVGNADITSSFAVGNKEIYGNVQQAITLPDDERVKVMSRPSATGYNIFQYVSSFKELYDYLNINIEHYNFKEIQGSSAFLNVTYKEASERGENVAANIGNGLLLTDELIGFSHTPSLSFYNDKAYVAMQTNTSGVETSTDTSIVLCKVNPSSNVIEDTIKIAGEGTYGGVTFDGACSNCYSYIVGTTLHIIFNAHVNGAVCLAHCSYDLSNDTFANSICNILLDSSAYTFNTSNFATYYGKINGIKGLGNEIVMSQVATDGTYYYCSVSSGDFHNGKTPIFKTTDFVNWEPFVVLPMKYGSDCELAIIISDGYMYGASRHDYTDATLCIWKMSMTSKEVIDFVQINDCATRPTWYKDSDNSIFLIHGINGRRTIQILGIATVLAGSYDYVEASLFPLLGYNSVALNDGELYIAIQHIPDGYTTPRIILSRLI